MDKVTTAILDILNAEEFHKAAFQKRQEFGEYDVERNVSAIAEILKEQYADISVENILEQKDRAQIIDFLNRLIDSRFEPPNWERLQPPIFSKMELEEFLTLAEQVAAIPREELAKTAPLLTTRTYLEMCRIVYDVTYDRKYPKDISTAYLFCEARMFGYQHEYDYGILGTDWDSPEEFARAFDASYHEEEMYFGGPNLYIYDESARLSSHACTVPKKYAQWTGNIYVRGDEWVAVKMFVVLRKANYPVYFPEYKEVYAKMLRRGEKKCTNFSIL